MFTPNVKATGIVFASLLLIASGGWFSSGNSPRAQAEKANDSKLKDLRKEKLSILQEVATHVAAAHQSGSVSFTQVYEASQAVRNAELDLCDTSKERVTVLEKMLTEAKDFEKYVTAKVQLGTVPSSSALKAKVSRLDVEIALERAKGD